MQSKSSTVGSGTKAPPAVAYPSACVTFLMFSSCEITGSTSPSRPLKDTLSSCTSATQREEQEEEEEETLPSSPYLSQSLCCLFPGAQARTCKCLHAHSLSSVCSCSLPPNTHRYAFRKTNAGSPASFSQRTVTVQLCWRQAAGSGHRAQYILLQQCDCICIFLVKSPCMYVFYKCLYVPIYVLCISVLCLCFWEPVKNEIVNLFFKTTSLV